MELKQVMSELKKLGSEQTVKTFRRHGAEGDMYGVKVGDLKKILKAIKGDQQLALDLWDTNNSDAMYLASLAADGSQFTKAQLDHWAKTAWWHMLSEYAVPFVTSEHPECCKVSRKWIRSRAPSIASSGWSAYAAGMSVLPDSELDLGEIQDLLDLVQQKIDSADGRVKYCMNGFVICVGSYVKPLLASAKAAAKAIGKVEVDMGQTACRVPLATAMIDKIEGMNRVGIKRKTAKC